MIDRGVDWHTHSSISDGADSIEVMAAAARDAGLHTWGLSDHVRAGTTWLPDYIGQVRALRIDGLNIKCGVEVKIMDTAGRLDLPSGIEELDYLLIADHQFPGPTGPLHPDAVRASLGSGELTPALAVEQLVGATAAAVRAAPRPAILAHLFSILPKCGLDESAVSDQLLDELAGACLATDTAVEANEKWRCPSARVLTGLAARGVRLTAGSDAHRAADVGQWAYVHEVTPAR
ncbi:putative hydrolase [Antricoccus suffuscus]|uniref:Putative hydrolase n=1 Tax=Antricoccus suffuscus TaxID=1629062 RepID=A0A2T1A5Z4_9ACTN|nr:PHP domain-containing protein [Antricoccus suffuscus]PRZ44033.1 putative hydrolase [Antricoccus suffuscus]